MTLMWEAKNIEEGLENIGKRELKSIRNKDLDIDRARI